MIMITITTITIYKPTFKPLWVIYIQQTQQTHIRIVAQLSLSKQNDQQKQQQQWIKLKLNVFLSRNVRAGSFDRL